MRGLSLVAVSGGHSSSRCAGLSLSRPLLLRSTGSRRAGSAIVALGPSCSAACGIFPDQGSNPCSLHWQADSQPLRHRRSPMCCLLIKDFIPPIVCPSVVFFSLHHGRQHTSLLNFLSPKKGKKQKRFLSYLTGPSFLISFIGYLAS